MENEVKVMGFLRLFCSPALSNCRLVSTSVKVCGLAFLVRRAISGAACSRAMPKQQMGYNHDNGLQALTCFLVKRKDVI